jgi:hypothetical protein
VNQSLNAGFNYSNRSGSDSGVTDLAIGYASAVAVSCGVAVGLGQMVKRAVGLSPATRAIVQGTVPFVAVASAGDLASQQGFGIVDECAQVWPICCSCAAKKLLTA